MASATPVICEYCDTVHRRAPLRPRAVARCVRCGAELYRDRLFDLDTMLALTLASLIVFVIANAYPIMTIEAQGVANETTLLQAILATYDSGVGPIAVVAAVTIFLFPLLQLCLYVYVLMPLRRGRVPRGFVGAMHALRQMQPWSMLEVFLIGMLVSIVKLTAVASVTTEAGFWGFAVLTVLLTSLTLFETRELWERAEEIGL
jgi:paraquat-inducible protein A